MSLAKRDEILQSNVAFEHLCFSILNLKNTSKEIPYHQRTRELLLKSVNPWLESL